jgi:acetyltransferase-like isoleucine patch superfamily enzyme
VTTPDPGSATAWAYGDQVRKRRINQLWVDAAAVLHVVVGLLPGPLRNGAWRLLLGSCGKHVFWDHKVYVKYPWLVRIGDSVAVNRGVEFFPDLSSKSGITIGSNVYLAPHVRFLASGHDLEDLEKQVGAPITVGDGCWIGAGALILPGVTIGDGAVVGAGAVVTKDVAPRTIVGGSPAQVLRDRDA